MLIDRRVLLGAVGVGAIATILRGRDFLSQADSISSENNMDPDGSFKIPIGMNLAPITDAGTGYPFKNLLWGARPWMTQNSDPGGPWNTEAISSFELDDDGYPLEAPIFVAGHPTSQIPFTLLPNRGKPGKYVVLYDGLGEISGKMGTKVLSSRPGRMIIQMTHNPEIPEGIVIRKSQRGNHVRNIRIISTEYENDDLMSDPFTPEFVDFCRPFHCLRFMDWATTNSSLEQEWSSRRLPSFYTMTGTPGDADGIFGPKPDKFTMRFSGGVAIEIMINLANKLNIDPWLCIPHRASDEYILEYAKLVKQKLNKNLKVYLEYSNEVWNFSFLQSSWMLRSRLAGDIVESKGGTAWKDASKTKGTNHPERIAALFRRTFAIWEKIWTGADRKRIVRVCSVQAGWLDTAYRTVKWCGENGGADAVSPAAYFGPLDKQYDHWASRGAALTADEVIVDMREIVDQQGQDKGLADLAAYAKTFGMGYVSYEGGQHIQPKNRALLPYNPALGQAQSHPGMYDLYVENLRQQRRLGSSLMCAYNSVGRQGTQWGSWGHKSSYDQPLSNAPKMRALLDYNSPKQLL